MNPDTQNLYDRTEEFALRVIRMVRALPGDYVSQVMGKQVLRSGTSIGANYREAARSRSKQEFIAKLGDCLKEAEETAYWFNLLVRSETVTAEKMAPLRGECQELVAILTASINTARRGGK